jgi:hypothetical protein
MQNKEDTSNMSINRNHIYYFQIIMQLYVTGRDFFIYHLPKTKEIAYNYLETIKKTPDTDALWKKMKTTLKRFYLNDMGPEIVDPIFPPCGTFRTPP